MSKPCLPILEKYCEETDFVILKVLKPPSIEGFKVKKNKIKKKQKFGKVLFHDLEDYLNNKNKMHYTFTKRGPLRKWWKKKYIVDKYLSDKIEWWKQDYLREKYKLYPDDTIKYKID